MIKKLLEGYRDQIHGMVHCSGGAQTKVLHFINPLHVIKDNMFDVPPLFRLIHEQSGTDWKEMYKVFNMGHRMEIYVSPENAQAVMDVAASFGIESKIIGRCEASDEKRLTIQSEFGTFEYS